jgi:hypothetical protein
VETVAVVLMVLGLIWLGSALVVLARLRGPLEWLGDVGGPAADRADAKTVARHHSPRDARLLRGSEIDSPQAQLRTAARQRLAVGW